MQDSHSINFIEVDKPLNNMCGCGHIASNLFKRENNSNIAYPTRFFRITTKDTDVIVCEPCLVVVNYLVRIKKKVKV